MAQPVEYDCTVYVYVRPLCGLFVKLLWPLAISRSYSGERMSRVDVGLSPKHRQLVYWQYLRISARTRLVKPWFHVKIKLF